jgi:GMP synthase (glutamine-hydrolysing)
MRGLSGCIGPALPLAWHATGEDDGSSVVARQVLLRVAIVENTRITHHGQVGVALHEAGALVDIFRPFADGRLPDGPDRHDALIVFGGEQSALDDAAHPYLPGLAQTMRAYGEAGRAVLGVCLGSQLLARAWGARNQLGTAPEFGWQTVRLTAEGQDDPVLCALPPSFPTFQWHSDTFTLPPGSVHLATGTGAAHQAFRIGRASYGTQFHFEANRAVVADWSQTFPDLVEHMSPGWQAAHPGLAGTLGVQADAAGLALARAFVAVV